MKRLISALILVLVLVPLMLLMRWGGEAKAPWSAASDGVQARLVSPRFLWRPDDAIPVVLRLKNRTAEERAVEALTVRLRLLHEGQVVREESVVLAPATLAARGETDLPLAGRLLEDAEPGLWSLDGDVAGVGLLPLKLRVVKPDGG